MYKTGEEKMSENIIEALIGLAGAVCTIIAAVIGKVKYQII